MPTPFIIPFVINSPPLHVPDHALKATSINNHYLLVQSLFSKNRRGLESDRGTLRKISRNVNIRLALAYLPRETPWQRFEQESAHHRHKCNSPSDGDSATQCSTGKNTEEWRLCYQVQVESDNGRSLIADWGGNQSEADGRIRWPCRNQGTTCA